MDNTTNDSMLIENNKKMRLQLQSRVEASKRDRTELQVWNNTYFIRKGLKSLPGEAQCLKHQH